MKLSFELDSKTCQIDLARPLPIGISLDFDGMQPNHFGVKKAFREPFKSGGFVGSTEQGGSCNVSVVQMIPHCNGTHTETVGHIVSEQVNVSVAAGQAMFVAVVVTVEPVAGNATKDVYRPEFERDDSIITRTSLEEAFAQLGFQDATSPKALVVRTTPNTKEKASRVYGDSEFPPFFSIEAMNWINELGIKHLLVDVPSIDRTHDDGLLTNHHLFWNVPERTHKLAEKSHTDKTITEMVFVPDEIKDGRYILNLQIAPFCSDAAPSRPILFAITEE